MKKYAFVVPWYGENIPGGAESATRDIIYHLKERGLSVEVLTTCVKEFSSDWNINYYKQGMEMINSVTVRRFPVRKRNTQLFDQVNYKFINNIPVSEEEENIFFEEMVNSPQLYNYIKEYADEYEKFVFIPYMFGTTYYGSMVRPDKSILIPCLHDESYAYTAPMKKMFENVSGLIFLSQAEAELANRIYNIKNTKQQVIGTGIDIDLQYSASRFRNKYNINESFILYAGRKDHGKNVHELVNFFQSFKDNESSYKNLKLVLIGGGYVEIPAHMKGTIIDLGFVDRQDKYDAYAAANIFCQPSLHESFSIVIMESWLCKTPILVNGKCEITKRFCQVSNGGLYYSNYDEFAECIKFLLNNKKAAQIMAAKGHEFVITNMAWDIVTQKYIDFLM